MTNQKILFLDRDGTLILEPVDKQIDSIEKFALVPGVIHALLRLKSAGFRFVMVSNQDGLGTDHYKQGDYENIQTLLLSILDSQGIAFDAIRVCPHTAQENCECRKPRVALLLDYITARSFDPANSYVIGDRETDLALAKNLGIKGYLLDPLSNNAWNDIANLILTTPRIGRVSRKTTETDIEVEINLDAEQRDIDTGIGFLDHMLDQVAKHAGFALTLTVKGDLNIDEHHTVEDTALALGEALRKALSDKRGLARYGFVLPMDEALAMISLDLSGRSYLDFKGKFTRESVGGLATELVEHFFISFADALRASIHIEFRGENNHHMIEAIFKGVGRCLRQALLTEAQGIPSTKGVL
jgi:imidazoleglycerol-phosphate dehydratase/histidinol-phosphatase